MKKLFKGPSGIPTELQDYNTAHSCHELKNLLLSPREEFCVHSKAFLGCNNCVSSIN
jgi:hypothetical protein